MRTGNCVIQPSRLPYELIALALWAAAAAVFTAIWINLVVLSTQAQGLTVNTVRKTTTAFTQAGFHHPLVEALLYNPPVDQIFGKYPYKPETVTKKLEPTLVLTGNGVQWARR
jgi:hypothetical protein